MFSRQEFKRVYTERVLATPFFEGDEYYHVYAGRYYRTLRWLEAAEPGPPGRVLEVGGGHVALLLDTLDGWNVEVADISDEWADSITRFDIPFHVCDLVNDEPDGLGEYDLIVLCEVIEHLPIPPYLALAKLVAHLRPGGMLFVTTPNILRFRNVMRLLAGRDILSNWFLPDGRSSLGHLSEYSAPRVQYQLERSGCVQVQTRLDQLSYRASSIPAQIGKWASVPLLLRRVWRDGIVAWGRRPAS